MYPTEQQSVSLAKSFGCAGWYYNYALNLTSETYKQTGKGSGASHFYECVKKELK
ncbi:helix-turn-helix domain-containing protein [Microcoleus sp. SVA1B1]|uniref:helix-turn-helix domain-containing protein n=1 Tax=Microcoleus sp. SVA1B1 TaxID=3055422 RepID=UPI002FD1302D